MSGSSPGSDARPRAGRDDDVLGLIRARAERVLGRGRLAGLHRDLAGRVDGGLAPDHRDLVLLHQEADAGVHPAGDAARALDDRGGVEADVVGLEPIILGVLHVVVDLGRAQQRLGRDAAPVRADAAEEIALDDRGLEAKLRRADRGDIAARSRADDDDVEIGVGHDVSPFPHVRGVTCAVCRSERPFNSVALASEASRNSSPGSASRGASGGASRRRFSIRSLI